MVVGLRLAELGWRIKKVIHLSCLEEWRRHAVGLIHECPKCLTSGKVKSWVYNFYSIVSCDLCLGKGWLDREPIPITKVVDWK